MVPEGNEFVVTASGETIVMLKGAVACCPVVSEACTVKLDVPALVGVPEIVPLAPRIRPAGSEPAVMDHV